MSDRTVDSGSSCCSRGTELLPSERALPRKRDIIFALRWVLGGGRSESADEGPTFIGTDNTANQRVASGAAVPARSKHFLRRYHVLLERVRSREITIGHVPDRSMPADFLTKWIGASKLNVSVEHVTNRRHAPMQPEAI